MIVVRDTEILKGKRLVATIGFFDGVHLGHCFLIHELKQVAEAAGLPSAVITFPEHPRAVLHSDYQPKLLNSFEEKLKHLDSTGIDYCIVLDFTLALSRLSAKEFIMSVLANQLQVGTLLIGYDHRFGHNREDGFEQYVTYGEACGIRVIKASQYSEGEAAVSSSEIRRLLSECRVEEADHLLTYPYGLKGSIVSGYKVGRKLGFPTANIRLNDDRKLLPAAGVYAVKVKVEGQEYRGMLNIGVRPTVSCSGVVRIEVNIFDFDADIYGKEIRLLLIARIRGERKFNGIDELSEQLKKDRQEVSVLLQQ